MAMSCQVEKKKISNFLKVGLADNNGDNSSDFEVIANSLSIGGH